MGTGTSFLLGGFKNAVPVPPIQHATTGYEWNMETGNMGTGTSFQSSDLRNGVPVPPFRRSEVMKTLALVVLSTILGAVAGAQESETGPAVTEHGEFYRIADAVEVGDASKGVRAVFDIGVGSHNPAEINKRIDTVARFLNMHLAAGFPEGEVEAVLVLHGTAARDALDNEAFEKRFGVANPNISLLRALSDAGVGIYLCGQSAASRGFDGDEIAQPVELVLSAMTVLLQKQAEGYGMIAF